MESYEKQWLFIALTVLLLANAYTIVLIYDIYKHLMP